MATIGRLMKNFDMVTSHHSGVGLSILEGIDATVMPVFTRCNPSTITLSPGFRPDSTTHMSPNCGPSFTVLIAALSSVPTTPTW